MTLVDAAPAATDDEHEHLFEWHDTGTSLTPGRIRTDYVCTVCGQFRRVYTGRAQAS